MSPESVVGLAILAILVLAMVGVIATWHRLTDAARALLWPERYRLVQEYIEAGLTAAERDVLSRWARREAYRMARRRWR